MTAGIDFAGTVEQSDSPDFTPGQAVVLTGWGVGERHPGGFAQRARVKAGWLQRVPDGCDAKWAMAIGTAGFTAMLCVIALERAGIAKDAGPVAVTGAAGGVGSVRSPCSRTSATRLSPSPAGPSAATISRASARARYCPVANGPKRPTSRSSPSTGPVPSTPWGARCWPTSWRKPATAARWPACGLAAGPGLKTTVLPFILRGVSLIGIESVYCPSEPRREAWQRLARDLPRDTLDA